MQIILQLITASMTLWSVKMAGDGNQKFNYVGLFNQVLWVVVIVSAGTYGLLMLTIAMTFMYSRNIYKHFLKKEAKVEWNLVKDDKVHWHYERKT